MTNHEKFDWPRLMALGLGVLRLSPDVFWSMTPREFSAALKGVSGGAFHTTATPLTRADLTTLEAQYPDRSPPDARSP